MDQTVLGMRGGFILPPMIRGNSYHTRKHGVSVLKAITLDNKQLLFKDKNGLFQYVDNTFEGLVVFLATSKVTCLGVESHNVEHGIGL